MTFLSVDIKAPAARRLLADDRGRFATLLERLGPDRDLVELDEPLTDDWVAWSLMRALRSLQESGRPGRASCSPASARACGRSGTRSSSRSPGPETTSGNR